MADLVIAALAMAACVFGASASAKLWSRRAYRAFLAGLDDTGLVPRPLIPLTTGILACGEAAVAAGLTGAVIEIAAGLPGGRAAAVTALSSAATLTSVLAGGIVVIMRRGTRARCACFGANSGRELGRSQLARNVVLLAWLVAGLVGCQFRPGPPTPAWIGVAVAAGAVAGLALTRFDDLIELFAPVSPSGRSTGLCRGRASAQPR